MAEPILHGTGQGNAETALDTPIPAGRTAVVFVNSASGDQPVIFAGTQPLTDIQSLPGNANHNDIYVATGLLTDEVQSITISSVTTPIFVVWSFEDNAIVGNYLGAQGDSTTPALGNPYSTTSDTIIAIGAVDGVAAIGDWTFPLNSLGQIIRTVAPECMLQCAWVEQSSVSDASFTLGESNPWNVAVGDVVIQVVPLELLLSPGGINLSGNTLQLETIDTIVELLPQSGNVNLSGSDLELETIFEPQELLSSSGDITLTGAAFQLETIENIDLIVASGDITLAGNALELETIENLELILQLGSTILNGDTLELETLPIDPEVQLIPQQGDIALVGDIFELLTQDLIIELLLVSGNVALTGNTLEIETQDIVVELLPQVGNIELNGDVIIIETSNEFVGLLPSSGVVTLLGNTLLLEVTDEFVELIPSSGIIQLEGNILKLRTIGGPAVATQDTPFVRYGLGSWDTRFAYLATHFNNVPLSGVIQLPYTFRVLGIELIAQTADEDSGFSDEIQVEAFYINPNESDEEVIIGTFKNVKVGANYAILVDAPIVMLEDPATNVSLEFRVVSGGVTGIVNVMVRPFEDFWKFGVGVRVPEPEPVT